MYVCLIGYATAASTHGHLRLSGVILPSVSREPIYHADNHFLVTFGNSAIEMVVAGRRHRVPSTASAISYSVALGGAVHRLAASAAPPGRAAAP